MTIRKFLIYLFIAVCLLVIVPPLHADGNQQVNVIYQSAFYGSPVDNEQPFERLLGSDRGDVPFLHRTGYRCLCIYGSQL